MATRKRKKRTPARSAATRVASNVTLVRAKAKTADVTGDLHSQGGFQTDPALDALADTAAPSAVAGSAHRQTLPFNANILGMMPWAFLPRRAYQAMDLTTLSPGSFSAQQLLSLLADAWPEASQALWNFLRLAAASWTYEVRTPDNLDEDPAGKAILDEIIGRVNQEWGGFQSLVTQWVMSAILQGACAGETIPSDDLTEVIDIVTVQPWTIFFQRDEVQRYRAFQWQPVVATIGGTGGDMSPDSYAKTPAASTLLHNSALQHGGFRLLSETTFGYVPLDPDVDDPYGRTPFAPVLQMVAWDTQMIKDLRQWSHTNAFGRLDIKVMADMATELMPPNVKANNKDRMTWLSNYLDRIRADYSMINPDDALVHFDNVAVTGVNPTGATFQVDGLIKVLERRVFRALKQLPILMGSNEGTTETWGTLQMEVYALGIETIQAVVASLMDKLLTVALRIHGYTSLVKVTFETLRASDRLTEAQADRLEAQNAAYKRDQGWITQDEASIAVTGSAAVAPGPQPDMSLAPDMPDQGADANRDDAKAPAKDAKESNDPKDDLDTEKARRKRPKREARTTTPPAQAGDPSGRTVGGRLTTQERAALLVASAEVLAEVLEERKSDESSDEQAEAKWRGPSSTRRSLRRRLATDMAAHFRSLKLPRVTLDHILSVYRDVATANFKGQWPPLEDAVRKVLATREARIAGRDIGPESRLSDDERAAMVAGIMLMLERDFPDVNEDLFDTIQDYRLQAYNHGGRAGLRSLGVNKDFSLTNDDLLHDLETKARGSTAQIQRTTRKRLVTPIVDGLEDGLSDDEIAAKADGVFESMAGSRADLIGQWEVDASYFQGSLDSWQRNGVGMKVWVTGPDPDPGAGANGDTPCRDNAYDGAIPIDDLFSSGDYAPPAHGYCECEVQESGDPADYDLTDPWTGE